jgi:ABC-2 type transport system ATP-binding protein
MINGIMILKKSKFLWYAEYRIRSAYMIQVEGVTKVYGSRKAVDNISFSVGDHEILGFLGPNGAGKSTTMNIISGYTSATAGMVKVNGREILEDPIQCKKQIGYLPEHPPLYPDMTVDAYLSFMFSLKKSLLPRKAHLDEICESVGLNQVRGRIIRNLSKGFQQRVGLAQAMLNNPSLLILDEPTVGLDPKQILEIRDLIKKLGNTCTVIFSTHILQEVQSVCDRIIVINNGVIIADDTQENLARIKGSDRRILLQADGPPDELRRGLSDLLGMKNVEDLGTAKEGGWEFMLESDEGQDIRREVFALLAEHNWPILALGKNGLSLEDIFLRLTAGDNSAVSIFNQNDADTAVDTAADTTADKGGE